MLPRALTAAPAIVLAILLAPGSAKACSEQAYIGSICITAADYCPKGYVKADGATLPVSQQPMLYSLYGDTFGGAPNAFNVPDVAGRAPISGGTLPGGHSYKHGEAVGRNNTTLSALNLPGHTHDISGEMTVTAYQSIEADWGYANSPADLHRPTAGAVLAPGVVLDGGSGDTKFFSTYSDVLMQGGVETTVTPGQAVITGQMSLGHAGKGEAFAIAGPRIVLNMCVAVTGTYPRKP